MTTNFRRTLVAALVSIFCLGPIGAQARDTRLNRIPNIDQKIVDALKKKKILGTKQLREHTWGWTSGKIDKWAKKLRVNKKALNHTVAISQLVAVQDLTVKSAVYLVHGCNLSNIGGLRGGNAEGLLKCIKGYHMTNQVLKTLPDVAKIAAWIVAAKTVGHTTEKVAWATLVKINRFFKHNPDITKKFVKRKLTNNIEIFEALNLSGKRDKFAKRNKIALADVEWYTAVADLSRLKTIGPRTAYLLYKGGVSGLGVLKGRRAPELTPKLATANKQLGVRKDDLTQDQVQALIDAAKPHSDH